MNGSENLAASPCISFSASHDLPATPVEGTPHSAGRMAPSRRGGTAIPGSDAPIRSRDGAEAESIGCECRRGEGRDDGRTETGADCSGKVADRTLAAYSTYSIHTTNTIINGNALGLLNTARCHLLCTNRQSPSTSRCERAEGEGRIR